MEKLKSTIKGLEGKLKLLESTPEYPKPEQGSSSGSSSWEHRALSAEKSVASLQQDLVNLRVLLDNYESDKQLHQSSVQAMQKQLNETTEMLQEQATARQQLQAQLLDQTSSFGALSEAKNAQDLQLLAAQQTVTKAETDRISAHEEMLELRRQVNAAVTMRRPCDVWL